MRNLFTLLPPSRVAADPRDSGSVASAVAPRDRHPRAARAAPRPAGGRLPSRAAADPADALVDGAVSCVEAMVRRYEAVFAEAATAGAPIGAAATGAGDSAL